MTEETLERAHNHSSYHRTEVEVSDHVGCFYCLRLYHPSHIVEWIDGGGTAICPKCGIDSVIGSASGFLDNFAEFLEAMHEYWFQRGTCGRCDAQLRSDDFSTHECGSV